MKFATDELIGVLSQFNPWWRGEPISDLPTWKRAAWHELRSWVINPPAQRAVLLAGARQIGKTTLLLQTIRQLLEDGVAPGNILYATLDHPMLKLAGIEAVLKAWREGHPKGDGVEYLFLDEAQFIRDSGTWVKHQVDFEKQRRIIFTGSALRLQEMDLESGVGRWHVIRLSTLSFYEYIRIKNLTLPRLRSVGSLANLFELSRSEMLQTQDIGQRYAGHFREYLLRGGFPQAAQVESITQAQRLLREDIVDKVLKRDMTALFGVRRVLELEQTFLFLCMHSGGPLDFTALCSSLEVKRPTAQSFIELLEAVHLIYKLAPFGYGKEVLRARFKIYLADAAIAPAVLLKGRALFQDPAAMGVAVETAVFKHLFARYYREQVRFTYWRGKKDHEVDLVAQIGDQLIPFEIKNRTSPAETAKLRGLAEFCQRYKIPRAYLVTREMKDFGLVTSGDFGGTPVMQVPAALLCYWMGESETAS